MKRFPGLHRLKQFFAQAGCVTMLAVVAVPMQPLTPKDLLNSYQNGQCDSGCRREGHSGGGKYAEKSKKAYCLCEDPIDFERATGRKPFAFSTEDHTTAMDLNFGPSNWSIPQSFESF